MTNVDDNGRIQLPLAIRYGLHLVAGDKIAVDQLGDGTIILKKIVDQQISAAKSVSDSGTMHQHQAKTSA
jgi:AbrB family looped-hinge helix DNA binding protein